MLNAFSVDVEDYFQVSAFEDSIRRDDWPGFEHRVVANTHCLLELLSRFHVTATFYVLGWTAQEFPGLVREIAGAGHELASHSFWHRLVYRMSPAEFREDIRRSKKAIEDAAGVRVENYRAPSFSITNQSLWAFEILVEEGFTIDSSVFPVYHDRYGIPDACRAIHRRQTAAGSIGEFPPAVVRRLGLNLPVSGGGYFRLYPYRWSRRWLQQVNQRGEPFVFYTHPWEIDPAQPRLRTGTTMSRWRHYVNLAQTKHKLEWLLGSFRFGSVREVMQQTLGAATSPALSGTANR